MFRILDAEGVQRRAVGHGGDAGVDDGRRRQRHGRGDALENAGRDLPEGLALNELNFDSINAQIDLEPLPNSWHNVIDLESAITLYTPLYQLLLSDRDFSRAVASLQLDESIAIYLARIVGTSEHLHLGNNRHPLGANRRVDAARDLVLHGLGTERMHKLLVDLKSRAGVLAT